MSIGENVRSMRKRAGLTEKQLGDKVGITESMVSQIERGRKPLSMPVAIEMSTVFNCSIAELAGVSE